MSEQQVLPAENRPSLKATVIYFREKVAKKRLQLQEANAESAALRASLAQSEAERERLQGEVADSVSADHVFELAQEIHELRAELARERERHQELRQVVKEYRNHDKGFEGCRFRKYPDWEELQDDRCPICKKADSLLEPQPAPVVTKEQE